MAADWERHSFYRILEVERGAKADDIKAAHESLVSVLDPDAAPEDEKKSAALARVAADAALDALSDGESRKECDARLDEILKAASKKKKIETKRKGTLQEQQSIEEDEKLQKATEKLDSAAASLADFYYDRTFKAARESRFDTVPADKLTEWLSSERAEAAGASRQKGGGTSFEIDWKGFTSVQDKRKERGEEIAKIVDELLAGFHLA